MKAGSLSFTALISSRIARRMPASSMNVSFITLHSCVLSSVLLASLLPRWKARALSSDLCERMVEYKKLASSGSCTASHRASSRILCQSLSSSSGGIPSRKVMSVSSTAVKSGATSSDAIPLFFDSKSGMKSLRVSNKLVSENLSLLAPLSSTKILLTTAAATLLLLLLRR